MTHFEKCETMRDTLYIIGNGFDLHHRIPSSYRAFGEYLETHDSNTYEFVDRYFYVDDEFWSEFEERLASFDIDTLIQDASDVLKSYLTEKWSDAYHHDYQFEIKRAVKAISVTLRSRFAEWVRQLPIPVPSEIVDVQVTMDPSAVFLNFNYTPSLQRLYDVPDAHILHIHGAAANPDDQLVLGHGWEQEANLNPARFVGDPEQADAREMEGQGIIDRYFRETFKPTAEIIRDNAEFFTGLSQVARVFVMGHSVSHVDHRYFHEVLHNIDAERVQWKISYFGDSASLRERVEQLGIAPHLVKYARLAEF